MPTVKGKKFPYTAKGKADAARARSMGRASTAKSRGMEQSLAAKAKAQGKVKRK